MNRKAQVVKDLHTRYNNIEKINEQYTLKANTRRKKGGLSAYEKKSISCLKEI